MANVKITEIQDRLLEIAVYLEVFCKENNIDYYLMGGSALGAIRHKGFIPWDDDIDVFMTFDNYNKFAKACESNLDNKNYYFQKEGTKEWPLFFSKLRMNGTTFIEEDTKNRDMHQGFYVDIMCLNNVSDNKIYRYLQHLSARLVTAQTIAERGYITDSLLKKMVMNLTQIFVRGTIKKRLLNFVRSLNKNKTNLVGHFFGRAKFKNTSFPSAWLGKAKYVAFSNELLPVPSSVEKYLAMRYGDRFMEMPDEKTKSLYPSHSAFVDLNKDYKEYIGKL